MFGPCGRALHEIMLLKIAAIPASTAKKIVFPDYILGFIPI
jgi:hypothetical protein